MSDLPPVTPVEPPVADGPPPPAPVPPVPSPWPLRIALLAIVALVAGVAAGRVLLRSKDTPETPTAAPTAQALKRTGTTVPVEVAALPAGLVQQGTFRCAEVEVPGGYTGIAEGATIVNASKQTLRLAFRFDVFAGTEQKTVSRRFEMPPDDKIPSVAMASKHVAAHITKCALTFTADSGYDEQKIAAVRAAASAAGCDAPQTHPIESRNHIDPPVTARYNTTPPTSGDHYSSTNPKSPANTGVHDKPIQNEIQIHNLEHGHAGVQYRDASKDVIDALTEAARPDFRFAFVAPYPNMPQQLALTAWGISLDCKKLPDDASKLQALVKAFIAAYGDHAPESIPGTPQ